MAKNAQTTTKLHSSHTLKVMLKILQASLQQYMNHELPDVQAGFRKGRGTRNQLPTSAGSWKKQESYAKAFDRVDHNKLENSERDGHTRPSDLPLEKSVCRLGSNS